jgi:hypothetical protein
VRSGFCCQHTVAIAPPVNYCNADCCICRRLTPFKLKHAVYLLLVAAAGHAYSMPMASPSRSMYYAMQVPVPPLMPRSILLGLVDSCTEWVPWRWELAAAIDLRRHLTFLMCR